jgi:acyl transferase domain-containing protein
MKRLSDAVADGDIVECVIRGTGVNQDGQTMGLTMPSSTAQFKLIRSTYAKAGLDPVTRPEDRCQYFEAHGTGTQAGDPEEASAIYQAFFGPDCQNSPGNMLQVGSVKTVIGHTEGFVPAA